MSIHYADKHEPRQTPWLGLDVRDLIGLGCLCVRYALGLWGRK